jgi:4-hydroxy-tetrahydrodipicolinate synthase
MHHRQRFAGVYVAPLTPTDAERKPDIGRWIAHCRWLLAQGCHGLMPLGSTGEGHSFTPDERIKLMDALAEHGIPMDRMLVGTSALAYPDAVRMIAHAVKLGARAVAVQPAFYYKAGDEGLYAYFKLLVDQVADSRMRLIIYDWENNLGVKFSRAVLERLFAEFPDIIVGIKDSNGDRAKIAERCQWFPDQAVFSGADATALAVLRAGGTGIMSAYGNIMCDTLLRLYREWRSEEGERCQAAIDAYVQVARQFAPFGAIKATMGRLSGDPVWLNGRPPLVPLSEAQRQALHAGLDGIGFFKRKAAE